MEFIGHDLKTKAYLLECECSINRGVSVPRLEENSKIEHLKKTFKTEIDISPLDLIDEVLIELSTNSFDRYASLFIVVDFECYCQIDKVMLAIYNAINFNKNLIYVTKIILTHSHITYIKDAPKFQKKKSRRTPKYQKSAKKLLQTISYISYKFLEEENINLSVIDNSILVQFGRMEYEYNEQLTAFESFLTELHKNRCQVSVQEIVTNVLVNENGVETFETTSAMGCYVFNINPALAIVFNHMNFNKLEMREASINDINRLKNSFIRKKIPLLIIKDGSAEEVKRVMNFVQKMKWHNMKNLYITVMSHGHENDIIYTKTDTYNIQDTIIKPLLANRSLKDTQKIVLVNACRGDIDPRYEDDDLEYVETDMNNIDVKLVTFYSSQRGYVSLLPKDGAVFIKEFCEHFDIPFNEVSMEEIAKRMETVLQKKMDFCEKVTDYCAKPGVLHNIKMEFKNLVPYKSLYKKFCNLVEQLKIAANDSLAIKDRNLNFN